MKKVPRNVLGALSTGRLRLEMQGWGRVLVLVLTCSSKSEVSSDVCMVEIAT